MYVGHTNYVTVGMKTITAQRMTGWLREYAEYCDIAGATKTADHARHVAKMMAAEVEPDALDETEAQE